MWAALASLVPFLVLLFQEFFSAQARSRAAGAQFKADQSTFQGIVQSALAKHLATMAADSAGAASGWDAADQDAKGPK